MDRGDGGSIDAPPFRPPTLWHDPPPRNPVSRQGASMKNVRARSIKAAKKLGYATNSRLPLLGKIDDVRNAEELSARILGLAAVVASAWGHPPARSIAWIKRERLWKSLPRSERDFLEDKPTATEDLRLRVDAL